MNYLTKKYRRLHDWIKRHWGKPYHCELCGLKEIPKGKIVYFDWSNKTGIYNKNRKNWWQLCKKCHKVFDISRSGYVAWNKGISRKFNNALQEYYKTNPPWNKGKKETRPEVIKKMRKARLGKKPWNEGKTYKHKRNTPQYLISDIPRYD